MIVVIVGTALAVIGIFGAALAVASANDYMDEEGGQ